MDAFHSERGRDMYRRLPKSSDGIVSQLESVIPNDSPIQHAFRKLRSQLERDGWWKRDVVHEAKLLSIWFSLFVASAALVPIAPSISTVLLALCMTNAGWLGHDYVHGVDEFSSRMRLFGPLAAGLSSTWWSDKHNKHHALTNEMGVDEDLATDPFLYLWPPSATDDSPFRKIQHYIFFVPFSFLFALWRIDSVTVLVDSIERKRPDAKRELYALMVHYVVLLTLFPLRVWLPAVFLSGLISALIVTPTHQSEELFDSYQPDWVTAQFLSTRNAVMTNPFSEWLWGGMQYQLEHHLFPSMPRSRYPRLRGIIQRFVRENRVPGGYRETGEFEILRMNWDLYRKVARADPVVDAPPTKGRVGQRGAIFNSSSPAASKPTNKSKYE